ncbi:MAG TPA: HEAT repeat domain-containing protein [Polyangiaceae bacterium]|nr:HEAT repeat domain-containing protein [Polyangiaceae bacterium]
MKSIKRSFVLGALIAGAASLFSTMTNAADPAAADTRRIGRAEVYKHLPDNSLEKVTTPDYIKSIGARPGNYAPTEIWRALEHGETLECLDCIPGISKLLYDAHPKTREIAAWWLRRRIFGVFGPGQVYARTVSTLTNRAAPERERAYAAEALGEFLSGSGVKHVSAALVGDPSALVRKSSASALERLNHQGPNGELATALSDDNEDVRLAALRASVRVHVFTRVDKVIERISDPSARVRKRAAENLGVMGARDAVVGLVALTSSANETDAQVRTAAVASLGRIADKNSRPAVEAALQDPNSFVRDAARIALRRL